MMKQKRIFIVGHPGAGKALFGKALAEKLGWRFVDADFGLEYYIGRSLSEIVGREGEKNFLDCQTEILSAQLAKENIVITTDASVIDSHQNCRILSAEFTVFLNASPTVQLERISQGYLPLLASPELKAFFESLHTRRDNLYQQVANISIHTDDNTLEEHVQRVIGALTNGA